MRGFDVLDPSLDLKKNYFLEASAGTGKTFTIENIVVRLLQEGTAVSRILIVTFTRAATLELKMRIRKRLEEKKMFSTLALWEEAKIFTIHGFCFHTLKEHAFLTGFSLNQTAESASGEDQKKILKDFLRLGLPPYEIHHRQLEKVIKKGRQQGLDGLLHAISQTPSPGGRSYQEIQEEILSELSLFPKNIQVDDLLELATYFKGFCNRQGKVHTEFLEGFHRTARLLNHHDVENIVDLPLIKMVPQNLKQKHVYPSILESCFQKIIPLLTEVSDVDCILKRLNRRASFYMQEVCARDDLFFYDDFIKQMQKNISLPPFAEAVRNCYDAVLIDEFQDTDPVQWDIFSTLFLNRCPLYLIGDPKQSIYRFRGADLYVYMKAREELGEKAFATLNRNFRSQPTLVDALNILFQNAKDIIQLPKTGQTIACTPIIAALEQKGGSNLTFCKAENEEALFAFICNEIERLKMEEGIPYSACAVLVKDRYQANRFSSFCQLPVVSAKQESLAETDAFPILEDLLNAALNPRERSPVIKALSGPLFGHSLQALAQSLESFVEPIYRYHTLLVSKGIVSFFQTISNELIFSSYALFLDMWHLVEIIAENTSSVEEYLPFFQKLKLLDPSVDLLKARLKTTEEAVRLMTLHVSKGLEFEAVFPVGLMCESDMQEPEEASEKMRQLYVALTRAKRHLYLPVTDQENTPLQVFLTKILKGETLEAFVKRHSVFSLVKCDQSTPFFPKTSVADVSKKVVQREIFLFPSCAIHSYSSLTRQFEHTISPIPLEGRMPAGSEVGSLLHKVFEDLDFLKKDTQLKSYLESKLSGTVLETWLEEIERLVDHTLYAQLPSPKGAFCLAEVDPENMIREMEFFYPSDNPEGYIKGFIDLFFEHHGFYYCVDWKSNLLKDYEQESLHEAMQLHQYPLQASLYQKAVQKYLQLFQRQEQFVGSFYLFLRGTQKGTHKGVYFL